MYTYQAQVLKVYYNFMSPSTCYYLFDIDLGWSKWEHKKLYTTHLHKEPLNKLDWVKLLSVKNTSGRRIPMWQAQILENYGRKN